MARKLKRGMLEDATFRRCRNATCGYFQNGGCRDCDDCAAAPFELRKSCQRCDDCENVEGVLRWGEKKKAAQNVLIKIDVTMEAIEKLVDDDGRKEEMERGREQMIVKRER